MAIDFDRLAERLKRNTRATPVITTARAVQQPDERFSYPILIIDKVLETERAVVVRNSKTGEMQYFTEKDLQNMFLMEVSLANKDRIIRDGFRESRAGGLPQKDGALQLLLAICRKAAEKNAGIDRYLKEIPEQRGVDPEAMDKVISQMAETLTNDEGLLNQTECVLQETLERNTRVDPMLVRYKEKEGNVRNT